MHLNVEEMSTVEKCVTESMVWMNSKMNAQSKIPITQDAVIKVADIIAKIQVCVPNTFSYFSIVLTYQAIVKIQTHLSH